jgi:hypothetical protein
MPLSARVCCAAQRLSAFARGVVEADDGVGERVEIEVVVLRWNSPESFCPDEVAMA